MKIKTSELTGAALDWAVAQAEEGERLAEGWHPHTWERNGKRELRAVPYAPSSDWSQAGPIIEREMREFGFDLWSGVHVPTGQFAATYCRGAPDSYVYGPTPLIAAMRCYVASKLGDTVDIPQELCK